HASVPAEQTPCSPVTQAPPPSGFPSSVCPSQSLSTPSQISGAGAPAWHESTPVAQAPAEAQAPTPQLVAKVSTVPSQSLSRLSQISDEGATLRRHWTVPPWQVCVPAEHTPCCPVEQQAPPPGFPSSVWPLQSLSTPSQISGAGVPGTQESTPPAQAPVEAHAPAPQPLAKPSAAPLAAVSG